MAIITFSESPTKGGSTEATLSKTELADLSEVSGDAYFSDQGNWLRVLVKYGSPTGGQKINMNFDASLASPTSTFKSDVTARDDFQILSIKIIDRMGGNLNIPRSTLILTEDDVDLAPSSPALFSATFDSDVLSGTPIGTAYADGPTNFLIASAGAGVYDGGNGVSRYALPSSINIVQAGAIHFDAVEKTVSNNTFLFAVNNTAGAGNVSRISIQKNNDDKFTFTMFDGAGTFFASYVSTLGQTGSYNFALEWDFNLGSDNIKIFIDQVEVDSFSSAAPSNTSGAVNYILPNSRWDSSPAGPCTLDGIDNIEIYDSPQLF